MASSPPTPCRRSLFGAAHRPPRLTSSSCVPIVDAEPFDDRHDALAVRLRGSDSVRSQWCSGASRWVRLHAQLRLRRRRLLAREAWFHLIPAVLSRSRRRWMFGLKHPVGAAAGDGISSYDKSRYPFTCHTTSHVTVHKLPPTTLRRSEDPHWEIRAEGQVIGWFGYHFGRPVLCNPWLCDVLFQCR